MRTHNVTSIGINGRVIGPCDITGLCHSTIDRERARSMTADGRVLEIQSVRAREHYLVAVWPADRTIAAR